MNEKKYNEKQYKALILKALQQKIQGVTIADIVILTGLPTDWVEFTLRKLLGEYPCRLRTNQKDELVYFFDFSAKSKHWQQKLLSWINPSTKKSKKYSYFPQKHIHQTLSYIFGETKKQKDKLFTEKIILNYIRHKGGNIVVAELIQITGWSIYQAEIYAARLLADYNGEVKVTDTGVIIYEFEELAQMDEESKDITQSLKIWERPIPEKQMNDNDEKTNLKLEKINRRSLTISSLGSATSGTLLLSGYAGFWLSLSLTISVSVLSFSSIVFLAPLLRKFFVYLENEKIRVQNVETFMLKGIFNRIQSHIAPEKDLKKMMHESKPSRFYAYWWNQQISSASFEYALVLTSSYQREMLLEKKALELEAEISVDTNGDLYYDFERLGRELETIEKLRQKETDTA